MWRYNELLPLEGPPTVGKNVGWTPLVKAERLGREKACLCSMASVT